MLIWLISDSMGPALTTFVAQNLGARNPERIRKGVRAGTAMSAGAVILISVGLVFLCTDADTFVCIFSGCSIPFRTGWNLQPDDGTVLLFLCPCRSIFRCLLRHGRYDTAYDHHAAGHLPAASAWYPAGTSGLWNDGMYCYDLYCFMDCGRSFFSAALAPGCGTYFEITE